jgi:hypothetical protein
MGGGGMGGEENVYKLKPEREYVKTSNCVLLQPEGEDELNSAHSYFSSRSAPCRVCSYIGKRDENFRLR